MPNKDVPLTNKQLNLNSDMDVGIQMITVLTIVSRLTFKNADGCIILNS